MAENIYRDQHEYTRSAPDKVRGSALKVFEEGPTSIGLSKHQSVCQCLARTAVDRERDCHSALGVGHHRRR